MIPLQSQFPHSKRISISGGTSSEFFSIVETIARVHTPTKTQLAALESAYKSTGDFLASCSEFQDILEQIYPHGSRQIGTTVRPLDTKRDGFDIDLVARLNPNAYSKYQPENGPSLLLKHIGDALTVYADRHQLGFKRWDRCITLVYAGGMTADIAPVIDSPLIARVPYGDTHGLIPDRSVRKYDSTNPRGYAKFYNEVAAISPILLSVLTFDEAIVVKRADIVPLAEVDEVFERTLSQFVQLIKLHRNITFSKKQSNEKLAPSSIFITTLVAKAYALEAVRPHNTLLDLLFDIVAAMPHQFHRINLSYRTEEWVLLNPSAPKENLASGMNDGDKQAAFWSWYGQLVRDLNALIQNIEQRSGLDQVLQQVSDSFGEKSAQAVQQREAEKRQKQRSSNTVKIFTGLSAPLVVQAKPHNFFGE